MLPRRIWRKYRPSCSIGDDTPDRRPDRIRQRLGDAHLRAARLHRHRFAEQRRRCGSTRHRSTRAAASPQVARAVGGVRDEAARRRARPASPRHARRCSRPRAAPRARRPGRPGADWHGRRCGDSEPLTTPGAKMPQRLRSCSALNSSRSRPERLHVARVLLEHCGLRLGVADAQMAVGHELQVLAEQFVHAAPDRARAVGQRHLRQRRGPGGARCRSWCRWPGGRPARARAA